MARIPCHVMKFISDRFFCFVTFSVRFSHCFGFIKALVDTGSPFTVLSPLDALKLKLPITTMWTGSPVYLAGFCFLNHPLDKVRLNFKTENAQYLSIDMKLGVLIPTKMDRKTINSVKHIPSLIGNDFLEDQKLTLNFDPCAKSAYLEHKQI
jgi:hypothetical protein